MFDETTRVVATPHGFACVVLHPTYSTISTVIEIRSGVLGPHGDPADRRRQYAWLNL